MAKIAWRIIWPAIGIVLVAGIVVTYLRVPLWSPDPRPANVPTNAVRIPIGKSNLWATCWMNGNKQTRCRIFNGGGYLLEDDVFLTYSGRPIVNADDLMIVAEKSGLNYLSLQDGEMLLPTNSYADSKRFVDRFIRTPNEPAAHAPTQAR